MYTLFHGADVGTCIRKLGFDSEAVKQKGWKREKGEIREKRNRKRKREREGEGEVK
jgi:hypothetical protein